MKKTNHAFIAKLIKTQFELNRDYLVTWNEQIMTLNFVITSRVLQIKTQSDREKYSIDFSFLFFKEKKKKTTT